MCRPYSLFWAYRSFFFSSILTIKNEPLDASRAFLLCLDPLYTILSLTLATAPVSFLCPFHIFPFCAVQSRFHGAPDNDFIRFYYIPPPHFHHFTIYSWRLPARTHTSATTPPPNSLYRSPILDPSTHFSFLWFLSYSLSQGISIHCQCHPIII